MSDTKNQKGLFQRIGEKFPPPVIMFFWLIAVLAVLSFILNKAGVAAIHPHTGETISVSNLLSNDGLRIFLTEFVENFQAFPILGIVVVIGAVTGLCEKTGFLNTAINMSVAKMNSTAVVFLVAFISVLFKMAGDICILIMPILAAALFYSVGRNPLAGAFTAYAATNAGFAGAVIPSTIEVVLTPVVVSAARVIDPDFDISVLGSFYGLFVNAIVIAAVTTVVTVKFVEPRLGKYTGAPDNSICVDRCTEITPVQRQAVKKAGRAVLIYIAIVILLCIPKFSIFRSSETGSLMNGGYLLSSINVLLFLFFLIPGVVYGKTTGQIRGVDDVIKFMNDAVADLAPFIVLGIIIGQFLRAFSYSNLGVVLGIKGGEALGSLNIPPQLITVLFILLVALINILISSCMSKFLIMAPIFIPMLMRLNISPAFTFWVYRIGDGITNAIVPWDPMFVMLLGTVQKYDKNANIGTCLKSLIPFSVAYFIVLGLISVIWMTLGIDVGVGGSIFIN